MPLLPITGTNSLNDFIQVYGIMLYPLSPVQRSRFITARYTEMRIHRFGCANDLGLTPGAIKSLLCCDDPETEYASFKAVAGKAHLTAVLMSLVLANHLEDEPLFQAFYELFNTITGRKTDCGKDPVQHFRRLWNEYGDVSCFHIAKPLLMTSALPEKCSKSTLREHGTAIVRVNENNCFYDLYLGMMDIERLDAFLAVSDQLRRLGSEASVDSVESLMDARKVWTVPRAYGLEQRTSIDVEPQETLKNFLHFCLGLQ